MIKQRLGIDDEFGVLISLAIAVGMIVGAVTTLWIGSVFSVQVETVVSRIALTSTENPSGAEENFGLPREKCTGPKIVHARACQSFSSVEMP